MKPNLFIVGAPKCGTTTLYRFLEEHRNVFISNPKEVNFFSRVELESQGLYYADYKATSEDEYLSLFKDSRDSNKIIAEASVSYLFYPNVAQRIHNFNHKAKIIIMLRNPVERAWSHYLMDKRLGLVEKSFMEIFQSRAEKDKLHHQQYFLLGNYSSQVEVYLKVFGKSRVKIILTEELKNNEEEVLRSLAAFLSVDDFNDVSQSSYNSYKNPRSLLVSSLYSVPAIRNLVKRFMPTVLQKYIADFIFDKKYPQLSESDLMTIKNYYRGDILRLEGLLLQDLTAWK